jgi:tetratricopeptide (TPR) repeat protein
MLAALLPNRRLAAACAGVLLLSACTIGPVPQVVRRAVGSTPSPGGPGLSAAQAAFFGNRYDEAEKLYRAFLVANPNSSEGHARFALFLNYNHQFVEATAEAELATRLDPRGAVAAAILTRVKDWSAKGQADLKQAARLGAEAVKLGPGIALTHTFYAEALADIGQTDDAKRELDAATSLATQDAYDRAEVERERANLARGLSDKDGELTHLKAAQSLQPDWVERTRELSEFYFGSGQLDLGTEMLRKAVALAPTDPNMRVNLGDLALVREDIPTADEAFAAADKYKPHTGLIEAMYAVTQFDLHRDAAAAEQRLRQAHADAPNDYSIADLLQGFLRYIKGDGAGADAVTLGGEAADPPRPNARTAPSLADMRRKQQELALATVNQYRAKAHLSAVRLDDRISEGATAHGFWWLFNLNLPAVKGLGIHHEVSGTPGYTGYNMRERASHFGYPPSSMAEDITHRGAADAAVMDWIDSVYHRFPIMRADLSAIGFGMAIAGVMPMETMDMGYRDDFSDPRLTVAYPADAQTDVPVAFFGNELPDPVPKGGKYPVGYPVTLNFSPVSRVLINDYSVKDAAGNRVEIYYLPVDAAEGNVLTLLPQKPLNHKAPYKVHVAGTINGVVFARDWSFTTEGSAITG